MNCLTDREPGISIMAPPNLVVLPGKRNCCLHFLQLASGTLSHFLTASFLWFLMQGMVISLQVTVVSRKVSSRTIPTSVITWPKSAVENLGLLVTLIVGAGVKVGTSGWGDDLWLWINDLEKVWMEPDGEVVCVRRGSSPLALNSHYRSHLMTHCPESSLHSYTLAISHI